MQRFHDIFNAWLNDEDADAVSTAAIGWAQCDLLVRGKGVSWKRINDDGHQFGWASTISGDPRVFGRVYVGTNGRGILYGDPLP